jgi:hypothetical protein
MCLREVRMDKLDKLFDRMTKDMVYYFIAGGLAEPDGLIRTVEFFLNFVDKGRLSGKLLDEELVKEALIHHLPNHMPLYIDESFYAYQMLLDLYYALYNERIITKEECKEMQYVIYLNKTAFLSRMSNPNYWSKNKLAVMDEWREGNFDIEEPYNLDNYNLDETVKKEVPNNILEFPRQSAAVKTQTSYVVRVDLKGYRPRIWRRLKIPASISYEQLHEILQIAFGWEDCHLHSFFVDKKIMIGPSDLEMVQFAEEQRLIDEDFKNKKTISYLYDFGCDWQHQLVIEKILEETPVEYAICVKAKGETPAEDSRGNESWKAFDIADINKELKKKK